MNTSIDPIQPTVFMLKRRDKKTSWVIFFELKNQKSLCQWNALLEKLKSDSLDLSENCGFKFVSKKRNDIQSDFYFLHMVIARFASN